MLHYGRHWLDDDDIQAVMGILKSGPLTQGPKVGELEAKFSEYVGAKFAVAVSNGTSALHIACLAAGIGPGHTVITSPNTFVASANCVIYAGGRPAFSDIDPVTLNIKPETVEKECIRLGNVKAIIPVHFAGLSCEMPKIWSVAQKVGATIIEDACHALGGNYPDGSRIGSCRYSQMAVFSLHPVKAITSGEGGIVTTNDENLYRQLLRLRGHGINKLDDPFICPDEAYTEGKINGWYYEMQQLGFNYRLSDIQCALAISQFDKLDKFIARRREIANIYDREFKALNRAKRTQVSGRNDSANHLYVLRVDYGAMGLSRNKLFELLAARGIGGHAHYIPVPTHPYYRTHHPVPSENYTQALAYYREALSLPLYPSMSDEDVRTVVKAVRELIG